MFLPHLGIQDELVPNVVFDMRFMPLFMVKNLVVVFNPNGPKSKVSKEVPNFDLRAILLGKPFTEESLFLIETIIVTRFHPTKFIHDVGGPPPHPPNLDTIPKFIFDRLTSIGKTKNTLFRNGGRGNPCPPFVIRHRLVPN